MMTYAGMLPVQPEVDEEQRRRIALCDELFGRAPSDDGIGHQVAVAVDDIGIAGDRIKGRLVARARLDGGDAVAQRFDMSGRLAEQDGPAPLDRTSDV